jgi:hypothetical protein
MRYRAWLPDPESLSVELDDASARASRNFGDALSAALGDVGATRMYTVKHLGARHVAKRGVIPYQVGPAAESLVVHAATIHVPARLVDEVGDRVVDALERRIGAWRRESGNEELEIPICGPDGRVLRVAKRDGEISLTDR